MYISEFNQQQGTNYANWRDVQNCQLYVVNGIVCSFFDCGKQPTSKQVMDAWISMHGNEQRMFSLVDIDWIIAKVAKYYEN